MSIEIGFFILWGLAVIWGLICEFRVWLKSDKTVAVVAGVPKVVISPIDGLEEEPKPAPDVSEPVISFCAAILANPKRFKISVAKVGGIHGYTSVVILDRSTHEVFTGHTYHRTYGSSTGRIYCKSHPWVTEDELRYIVSKILKVRMERSLAVRLRKKDLRDNLWSKERSRLEAIYKGAVKSEH